MKKPSSYQKLKAKNQLLTEDIKRIVQDDCPVTKFKYKFMFDVDDAIWFGDACQHDYIHKVIA